MPYYKYSIKIDTKAFALALYQEDDLRKTYKIAIGKPSTPTPKGNFTIINKAINPGGPFGARWLGLSLPHYGIHGTNEPSSIGKPVSNGCIRMYNKDVIELSELIPIGTKVSIV